MMKRHLVSIVAAGACSLLLAGLSSGESASTTTPPGSSSSNGLVPIYWNTGGLMNRATGVPNELDVITMIVNATQ